MLYGWTYVYNFMIGNFLFIDIKFKNYFFMSFMIKWSIARQFHFNIIDFCNWGNIRLYTYDCIQHVRLTYSLSVVPAFSSRPNSMAFSSPSSTYNTSAPASESRSDTLINPESYMQGDPPPIPPRGNPPPVVEVRFNWLYLSTSFIIVILQYSRCKYKRGKISWYF